MNEPRKTGFLRLPEVLKLIPVGRTTFLIGVRSGRYPKSFKISDRLNAWRAQDIYEFIDNHTHTDDVI